MRVLESPRRVHVRQLAFSPCGTLLIAGEGDRSTLRRLCWWSVESGTILRTEELPSVHKRVEIAVQTGAIAYSCGSPIERREFDGTTRPPLFSSNGVPFAIAYSADGRKLAVSTPRYEATFADWRISVLSDESGVQTHNFFSRISVQALAFSLDGTLFASAGRGGFTIWDFQRQESIMVGSDPHGEYIKFAPDGYRVAIAAKNRLQVSSSITGELVYALLPHARRHVTDFVYSPDGQILATAAAANVVQFWDAPTGELRQAFDWSIGKIHSVAFSPDGLTAAAGGDRGQIVIWDVDE